MWRKTNDTNGFLYYQQEQVAEALGAWVTAYRLAQAMNLAQILQALAQLASQVGLPGGLAGWAALAQRMDAGGRGGIALPPSNSPQRGEGKRTSPPSGGS